MQDIQKYIEIASEVVAAFSIFCAAVNKGLSMLPPQWRPWTDALSRILNAIAINSVPAHKREEP